MFNVLIGLAIVAATGDPAHGGRHPDAVEVFHCTFDDAWDANYDEWPDHWVRKQGRDYPHYLKIAIDKDASASKGRCLKIELDGGGATVFSPPIAVDTRFSYVLETNVRADGLVHDRAFLSVTFYDAERQPLETIYSDKHRELPEWTKLRLGPFHPSSPQAEIAVIGLHLMPGERQDLRGWAKFDDIWLARLPRMTLTTNSPHNVYTDPSQVRVICSLSGILERDPQLQFELLDASSNSVAQAAKQLDAEIIAQKSSKVSDLINTGGDKPAGYAGTTEWQPPLSDGDDSDNAYGFYRVRVTMRSPSGIMHRREITFAVIRPAARATRSEFGWTLPQGDEPLSLDALCELLPQVGISWLKIPVWFSESTPERGDQLMWFAERLSSQNIEVVGLLADPPEEVLQSLGTSEPLSAASVFSADPALWFPSLDPVMTRLSLKIRWWQLGGDHDTSFVGYPKLVQKIDELKKKLYRFGQEVHLGIGWHWMAESPADPAPPWEFLSLSASPPLTGSEITTYLSATEEDRIGKRWVLVEPLPRRHYTLESRTRDLVEQMMAAKIERADGIFVPNPFSTEAGLMNDDGTPGELLLPWRTTALVLGGAEYLGSIQMPQGSQNHIFARNGEAVMVVWNDRPVEEVLYLGDDVRQIDVWGRTAKPASPDDEEQAHCQIIPVSTLPTFLVGVNEQVARWRMAVRFEQERMPSVFGKPHRNGICLKNTFPQGGGGEIELVTPHVWSVYPQRMNFKLAVGEEMVKPFEAKLPFTASSGLHDVRIDFNINVDRNYRFSVYRQLGIGLGDVEIEVSTKLDEHGTLIVEQRMLNKSDQIVDFKCLLHAPDRRRQSNQVFRLGRGEDVKHYYFPNGAELLGEQLWLRAEEIGGQRMLNYRFTVKEE